MRQELELARQLIEERQYDKARALLERVPEEPMAKKWLEKLDERPTIQHLNGHRASQNGHSVEAPEKTNGWQYMALEVKKSYGLQYRANGTAMPDWKDQPINYALNELGRDGWELVGFEGKEEVMLYILKKPGAVKDNRKIAVWDQ